MTQQDNDYYYKVLGLQRCATLDEVKRQYRYLVKKHHPDYNNGDQLSEIRMKEINYAYARLCDIYNARNQGEERNHSKRDSSESSGPKRQDRKQTEWTHRPHEDINQYSAKPDEKTHQDNMKKHTENNSDKKNGEVGCIAQAITYVVGGTIVGLILNYDSIKDKYTAYQNRKSITQQTEQAEQGDPSAQFSLGNSYYKGQDVPQDFFKAAYWYQQAAEQGHSIAQNTLGDMYCNGLGVPQNFAQAAHWFQQAAEQGHIQAQSNIGHLLVLGMGVQIDEVSAYAWYNIAAAQGLQTAKEAKNNLSKRMTEEQVDRAQSQSQQFWNQFVVPFREID